MAALPQRAGRPPADRRRHRGPPLGRAGAARHGRGDRRALARAAARGGHRAARAGAGARELGPAPGDVAGRPDAARRAAPRATSSPTCCPAPTRRSPSAWSRWPRATRSTPRRSCATSSTAAARSPRSRPRCARCSPRASMRCPRPSRTCCSTPRSSAAASGPARWSRAGGTSRSRRSCARSSAAASSWRGRRRRCPASASWPSCTASRARSPTARSRAARAAGCTPPWPLGRGAGRRPPRRVPRRARPPLRGRGRAPTRRSPGPRARRRPTELRAAAVRTLVEAGEAARRRLSLAQALRYADRALALAEGPAERLAAFELRAQQPPRGGPRQPGARRLSRGDRARPRARRRRGHGAPARLRDPAVQPLPGSFIGTEWKAHADDLVDRGLAEAGEDGVDFATAALLIGRAWGTWRWRDPIAEDLPRAKRDAERAAQIAEAIGSSLLVSVALEALTWIAFSQGDCEAVALGERHLQAAATLADRFEAHESLNMAVICFVRAGRFDRACEIAAESARQAPGMSAHRALHAVASQAIALAARGRLRRARRRHEPRGGARSPRSASTSARTRSWRWRRAPSCCTRAGSAAAARAALELFDTVAPPDRPLVRWGPWIVEMQRAAAGLEATRGPPGPTSRSALRRRQRGRHPAGRAPAARAARRVGPRRRAGGPDAGAGRLDVRAGARATWPIGPTRCAWPPTGNTSGRWRSAARPPPRWPGAARRYAAARLMTDLLARRRRQRPRATLVTQTAAAPGGDGCARQRRRRARRSRTRATAGA